MPNPLRLGVRRGVEWIMRRSLRAAFSQVGWVGPPPPLPTGTPVVCYANHHTFYDGYLLWLLVTQHLGRPGVLWMREWDRVPFFAVAGAMPFPDDDPARRARTIRATARFLRRHPDGVLVLFPGGELHPPEEGVANFPTEALRRLDRLLPPHVWWPVAIHTTWREATRPVAHLAGGTPHPHIDGDEPHKLAELLGVLGSGLRTPTRILLRGRRSPASRWNLQILRHLFDRTV